MTDVLDWFQSWYAARCDGDWEHCRGVKISTLDNPGWWVEIDLNETPWEDKEYPRTEVHRTEDDRVVTWISELKFHIACGSGNLGEGLTVFRHWTSENAPR